VNALRATERIDSSGPRCAALEPLVATLMACSAVLLAFVVVLNVLTDGFEHWTFEDLRREKARQGHLAATALEVRTSQTLRQILWGKADGDDTVYLVNFIYTSCPTVCQALGAEYTQMQAVLKAQSAQALRPIRLVSLSFDVARDGPAELAAHARLHRADSSVWTVAAPASPGDASRVLRQLGVVVVPDGLGGYVHNGAIHVMNSAGAVLAIFDDADWRQALATAMTVSNNVDPTSRWAPP
jgi:protein SCO1